MANATSAFTVSGKQLLAAWLSDPSSAKPISLLKMSDSRHTSYTGNINEMRGDIKALAATAAVQDPVNPTLVKFSATVVFSDTENPGARGQTLKEIGLFAHTGAGTSDSDYTLMWVGSFPDTTIPQADQTAASVSIDITVPIQFENVNQINLTIDSTRLEQRVSDAEGEITTAAVLINKLNNGTTGDTFPDVNSVNKKVNQTEFDEVKANVNTMKGNGAAQPKANQSTVDSLSNTVGSLSMTVNTMKGDGEAAEKADKTYVDSSFVSTEYMTYSLIDAPMTINEPAKKTVQLGSTSFDLLSQVPNDSLNVSGWGRLSSASNVAYNKPISINAIIRIGKTSGLIFLSGDISLQIILNPRQDSSLHRAMYGTCVYNFIWHQSGGSQAPQLKLACDSYSDTVRLFFSVTDDWDVNVDSAWVTFQKQ